MILVSEVNSDVVRNVVNLEEDDTFCVVSELDVDVCVILIGIFVTTVEELSKVTMIEFKIVVVVCGISEVKMGDIVVDVSFMLRVIILLVPKDVWLLFVSAITLVVCEKFVTDSVGNSDKLSVESSVKNVSSSVVWLDTFRKINK